MRGGVYLALAFSMFEYWPELDAAKVRSAIGATSTLAYAVFVIVDV